MNLGRKPSQAEAGGRPTGLIRLVAAVCGIALVLLGLWVLLRAGVLLPTRSPSRQFHFSGLSQLLLGASPLVTGFTCLAIAQGGLQRQSRTARLAIGVGLVTLGLAFALAPKA